MTLLPNMAPTRPAKLETLFVFLDLLQYYSDLLCDVEIRTAPLELHDRKARRQMLKLLSRRDALMVLIVLYQHTESSVTNTPRQKTERLKILGSCATPAAISRLLWQYSNLRTKTLEPTRAQCVQASRIVQALLAFDLAEPANSRNRKERPVQATPLLRNMIEQLIDYSGWKMNDTAVELQYLVA